MEPHWGFLLTRGYKSLLAGSGCPVGCQGSNLGGWHARQIPYPAPLSLSSILFGGREKAIQVSEPKVSEPHVSETYFVLSFQSNGSLLWCENHKQCSKVRRLSLHLFFGEKEGARQTVCPVFSTLDPSWAPCLTSCPQFFCTGTPVHASFFLLVLGVSDSLGFGVTSSDAHCSWVTSGKLRDHIGCFGSRPGILLQRTVSLVPMEDLSPLLLICDPPGNIVVHTQCRRAPQKLPLHAA